MAHDLRPVHDEDTSGFDPALDPDSDDFTAEQDEAWPDAQYTQWAVDDADGTYEEGESVPGSDPLAFADRHLAELGLTLDFGPGDLAANQVGALTEPQIAQLESDLRWLYWPMIGLLALIAFLIGATSALAGTLTAMPFVLMGLAAIPAVLLSRERAQLPDRRVQATTLRIGRFSLVARRWGVVDDSEAFGGVRYPVEGGKPVWGPKHLYKVLQPNRTYFAYYVPLRTWRGYRLLSIEPAEDEAKPKAKPKGKRKRFRRDA
jgi:hypothetical protein